VHSGIMSLPMLLGVVFMAMISGGLITLIGYYVPFMIMSTIVAAIGMGLISTLKTDSNHSTWIGFEALFGLGIGAGLMQAVLIAQTVLTIDDSPTGTAALIFFQTLGAAIMVSVSSKLHSIKKY
jgi:hypothetical protein